MTRTSSFLTMQVDPKIGLRYVQKALANAGLEVQLSFDLLAARASHASCTCPHHYTGRCICQMVVLLVYGLEPTPATLVVHGREGMTHLAMVEVPGGPAESTLVKSIKEALHEQLLTEQVD